jgi:predicted transcriptional regulator
MVFLYEYKTDPANDGNSPTYAEIASALGLAQTTVYNAVQKLVAKGRLRLNKNRRIVLPGGAYHPPDE